MTHARRVGAVLLISLTAWLVPLNDCASASSKTEALYQKARRAYYALQSSPEKKKKRVYWEQCIRRFQAVYKTSPDSDRADDSLFMVGTLYENLSRYSGLSSDLDLAISPYQRLTTLYPSSRYADDAQFRIGVIHQKTGDYEKAFLSFSKVVERFPKGDMVDEARKRLAQLEPYRPKPKRLIEVTGIRHWSNAEYTRVVIDLEGETAFRDHILKRDPDRGKPPRIYIDIQSAQLGASLNQPIPIQDGLLTMARAAQYAPDVVRVVLDMESLSTYRTFPLTAPFRIIIDVHGNGRTSRPPEKENRSPQKPSLPQQLGLGIRRVVIDPGHGGKDPGAIGPGGLKEKNVVLKIAKKLERKLKNERGLEPVLTRRGDVFIPLDERTAIANTQKADLFVSIHANATRGRRTRGIETYVLNFATDEEAMELAALENAVSTKKLSDLQYILYDLMRTAKIGESRTLAEHVQESVYRGLKRKYSRIRNLGVKEAPFYVLIGANMPCILVEVSFISNREEEKRLRDDRYLEEIADGISNGIGLYMAEMERGASL
ncbi:MAG: AMIN domain-containing protein [Proteobacteria bacterium]|nr:AMIN domain-containing protein [Pseudomonadota bacterium]